MSDLYTGSRASRLDAALHALLTSTPELEAAAVVSFDGLPMASALPVGMDEDRVAAMSAALLSLGERAAQGLGRGELSQVYIEGEDGTVFLVSAEDAAVLVAVATRGAKIGMMLFEVKRAAAGVAAVLRPEPADLSAQAAPASPAPAAHAAAGRPAAPTHAAPAHAAPAYATPVQAEPTYTAPVYAPSFTTHDVSPFADAAPDSYGRDPYRPDSYDPDSYRQESYGHDHGIAAVPAPSAPVDSEPVWPGYAPALPADPQTWA